ncbi:hypothetical protein Pint_10171 [Pistacia integerrima]|uniref:Uncharacterized protein n=1 Tax=Pistacia integerrima TaxID=434235 RepID=A0ACC0XHU4_9ROSI|nr:hypothetical protein Pint_10171 [Pistacia integerrima]
MILVADYQSLHINCGGQDVTIKNTKYEGDRFAGNGATLNYPGGTNWGFISTGDFMDDGGGNDNGYTLSTNHTSFMNFPELYSTARASPLVLTYNGYCLENGNYTVNLHFAEISFNDDELYNRVGRRIFNIYVQGRLEQKDFNIREEANGTGKVIIKRFNATVANNTLEIRLYWAGKGTVYIPKTGNYGPLISAISVSDQIVTAFDLQQKGNLMDLVDENLANEFNKKEAERMIKVALLSCNATPSLRPTMTEVVSMLEEQTDIQDVISDPSIYNGDLQLKPLEDQSSTGSSTQKFSSDQTSLLRSTTSAHDLYSINSESIRGLTSAHDLYPLSSNTISLNQKDSSSISHHSS